MDERLRASGPGAVEGDVVGVEELQHTPGTRGEIALVGLGEEGAPNPAKLACEQVTLRTP
jgi:hypothetical protein